MSQNFFSFRRGLAAGGAVLLLGGSAFGIAAAQSAPATNTATSGQARPGYQAFIDVLAKHLGISSATLETAVSQARTDVGLPASGGFGPGRDGARGGADLNAAATTVGIPLAQLQQELATKSLADIATAHGKTPADVATALKNAAHQHIDQQVTAGAITAADAVQAKQQADQRIDQRMTIVGLHGPKGSEGRGGQDSTGTVPPKPTPTTAG